MSQSIIICAAVDELVGDPEGYVPGSEVRWCYLCAREVLVAPSGLAFIETDGALPACADCVAGLPEAPVDFVPGSREEMRKRGETNDEIAKIFAVSLADLAARRARRR